jgi:hypothetical protein
MLSEPDVYPVQTGTPNLLTKKVNFLITAHLVNVDSIKIQIVNVSNKLLLIVRHLILQVLNVLLVLTTSIPLIWIIIKLSMVEVLETMVLILTNLHVSIMLPMVTKDVYSIKLMEKIAESAKQDML